jgi:hypothetical protein
VTLWIDEVRAVWTSIQLETVHAHERLSAARLMLRQIEAIAEQSRRLSRCEPYVRILPGAR